MFWQRSHQNLWSTNDLPWRLLYPVGLVGLSTFMCLRSCLSPKYLGKVLKTTSSLKWVWNGWNFVTFNRIRGRGLLQCCWNLRVTSVVRPNRLVQLVYMWLYTHCVHNDSLVFNFWCWCRHWRWRFHGGNITSNSYCWIGFHVGVIVVLVILNKLFGLLKGQVGPYTNVSDFEDD